MKLNKKLITGLCVCALAVSGIAGAIAYFGGTADPVENTFSIVSGESDEEQAGEINEYSWVEDDAQNLAPNQAVAKDPTLTSNVDYDAWVFLEVDIPSVSAYQGDDEEPQIYQSMLLGDINDGWKLVASEEAAEVPGTYTYYYGYEEPLEPGGTTSALFNEIIVPDFMKLEEAFEGNVVVSGAMIQAVGYDTLEDAAEALGILGN